MKKFSIPILLVVLMSMTSISARAQQKTMTVDNQSPGWLSSKIGYGDRQTVENLKITGYINNEDLTFISSLARNYSLHGRLDLEDVYIVGDTNDKDNYLIKSYDIFYKSGIKLSYLSYPKSLKGADSYAEAMQDLNLDTLYINTTTGFTRTLRANVNHLVIGDNVTVLNLNQDRINIQTLNLPPTLKEIRGVQNLTIENAKNLKEFPSLEILARFTMNEMPDSIYFPKIKRLGLLLTNSHVFFGDSIEYIGYMDENYVINLHFSSPKPPSMSDSSGKQPYGFSNYRLYIPKGSADAYRSCFKAGADVSIIEENVDMRSITLDKHELNIKVGESETIKVGIIPDYASNKTINWSSDNTDVVVVNNNGRITAKKAGRAIITASSVSNPEVKDVCEVTVIQPVLGINIVEPSIKLVQMKDTKQLTTIINPDDATDKTIIWSSMDENIATVNENGIVSAKLKGNTTIVATSASNPEKTDICEVIVIQPVTGIKMDEASITFEGIGKTTQLTATVLPDDASDKALRWSSSNTSVCTVSDGGFIVAVGIGVSVVTATTVDGGFVAVCIVTVKETDGIVSIDIDSLNGNEHIYDAQGKRIAHLQRGVNIIRMNDGTIRKVVVK